MMSIDDIKQHHLSVVEESTNRLIDECDRITTLYQASLITNENIVVHAKEISDELDETIDAYNTLNTNHNLLLSVLEDKNSAIDKLKLELDKVKQTTSLQSMKLKDKIQLLEKELVPYRKENKRYEPEIKRLKDKIDKLLKSKKLYDKESAELKVMRGKLASAINDKLTLCKLVDKYNLNATNEYDSNGTYYRHFYDDEESKIGTDYWVINIFWHRIFPTTLVTLRGMKVVNDIDFEIIIINSYGVGLSVNYSMYGNILIPIFETEKPFGITTGLVNGVCNRVDQFMKINPDHRMAKQIELMRSLELEAVYTDPNHLEILNRSKFEDLYTVMNYLTNIEYDSFSGMTPELKNDIIGVGIKYMEENCDYCKEKINAST